MWYFSVSLEISNNFRDDKPGSMCQESWSPTGLHTLSDHQGGSHYSLGSLLPIKLTKSGQQPKRLEHPQ